MRGVLQEIEKPTFLNHADDFRIVAQRDDLWIFGQLFRAGIGEKALCILRIGNNFSYFSERFIGRIRERRRLA